MGRAAPGRTACMQQQQQQQQSNREQRQPLWCSDSAHCPTLCLCTHSGMEVARRLSSHPKISRVWYPGLESHPDHAIAKAQMSGFGGVVSFEIEGDLWACARFIDNLKIPYIAPRCGPDCGRVGKVLGGDSGPGPAGPARGVICTAAWRRMLACALPTPTSLLSGLASSAPPHLALQPGWRGVADRDARGAELLELWA